MNPIKSAGRSETWHVGYDINLAFTGDAAIFTGWAASLSDSYQFSEMFDESQTDEDYVTPNLGLTELEEGPVSLSLDYQRGKI